MAKLVLVAVVVLSVLGITGCDGAPRAIQGQRYDPADVEVHPVTPGSTGQPAPIPPGSARLTGKVSDEAGSRVVGALVEIRANAGGADASQSTTDLRGSYSFDLRPGPWRMLVTKLGYCPEFRVMQVGSMEEHIENFSLRAVKDC